MKDEGIMMRVVKILFVVLLLWQSVFAYAGDKKEEKEQLRMLVEVLQMEDVLTTRVPRLLMNDDEASEYCSRVLNRDDEAYSRDTARVNDLIRKAEWLINRVYYPDEKQKQKLIKQGYHPDSLSAIYGWAHELIQLVHPRYSIVTKFCEKQLQRRREAQQRKMPEGRLVSFSYREYGSSRPNEFLLVLERDKVSQRWQLNGQEVPDGVADEIRSLVERYEVYHCLSCFEEGSPFIQSPLKLGGPPSWSFTCQFEGGTIHTESECVPIPENCSKIVSYVENKLKEVCKNKPEND